MPSPGLRILFILHTMCHAAGNVWRRWPETVDRQMGMGLDVVVQVSVPYPRHDARVCVGERREAHSGDPYPVLHKSYETPAGRLHTTVSQTEDWPWGDHVPFLDDFLIPRSRKFLVTADASLDALAYLLGPPTEADGARCKTIGIDLRFGHFGHRGHREHRESLCFYRICSVPSVCSMAQTTVNAKLYDLRLFYMTQCCMIEYA